MLNITPRISEVHSIDFIDVRGLSLRIAGKKLINHSLRPLVTKYVSTIPDKRHIETHCDTFQHSTTPYRVYNDTKYTI